MCPTFKIRLFRTSNPRAKERERNVRTVARTSWLTLTLANRGSFATFHSCATDSPFMYMLCFTSVSPKTTLVAGSQPLHEMCLHAASTAKIGASSGSYGRRTGRPGDRATSPPPRGDATSLDDNTHDCCLQYLVRPLTTSMSTDSSVFDSMPKFDSSTFQPPAWASGPAFDFLRKNGESSKSGLQSTGTPSDAQQRRDSRSSNRSSHSADLDEEDEVWEDARDDLGDAVEETEEGLRFTTQEMKVSSAPYLHALVRL